MRTALLSAFACCPLLRSCFFIILRSEKRKERNRNKKRREKGEEGASNGDCDDTLGVRAHTARMYARARHLARRLPPRSASSQSKWPEIKAERGLTCSSAAHCATALRPLPLSFHLDQSSDRGRRTRSHHVTRTCAQQSAPLRRKLSGKVGGRGTEQMGVHASCKKGRVGGRGMLARIQSRLLNASA